MRGCSVFTVFTSDHLCIESIQWTLNTWVVWSETRRKWCRYLWRAPKGHGMLIWYLRRGRHHCWGHGVLERTLPGRGTAHLDQCGEEKCLFLFKIPLLPNFEIRDSNSTHIFWGQGGLERTLQAWPRHIWIIVGTIYILATKYLWGHTMLNSKSNLKCHPNRKDYGNTLYWCWIREIFALFFKHWFGCPQNPCVNCLSIWINSRWTNWRFNCAVAKMEIYNKFFPDHQFIHSSKGFCYSRFFQFFKLHLLLSIKTLPT